MFIFRPRVFFLLTIAASLQCVFSSCKEEKNNISQVKTRDTLATPKNVYASIDQSPLDIAYCPSDFPQKKMSTLGLIGSPVARVIYSRPHKKGRKIFGADSTAICPFGKPWRLGANESTEIEFFQPVVINGTNIKPGRYVMYCIPDADKWIVFFNSNLDSWGLAIDSSKDIFRVEVPVQEQTPMIEDFTIHFNETVTGADLLMAWDNVKTLLPITYSK